MYALGYTPAGDASAASVGDDDDMKADEPAASAPVAVAPGPAPARVPTAVPAASAAAPVAAPASAPTKTPAASSTPEPAQTGAAAAPTAQAAAAPVAAAVVSAAAPAPVPAPDAVPRPAEPSPASGVAIGVTSAAAVAASGDAGGSASAEAAAASAIREVPTPQLVTGCAPPPPHPCVRDARSGAQVHVEARREGGFGVEISVLRSVHVAGTLPVRRRRGVEADAGAGTSARPCVRDRGCPQIVDITPDCEVTFESEPGVSEHLPFQLKQKALAAVVATGTADPPSPLPPPPCRLCGGTGWARVALQD